MLIVLVLVMTLAKLYGLLKKNHRFKDFKQPISVQAPLASAAGSGSSQMVLSVGSEMGGLCKQTIDRFSLLRSCQNYKSGNH